MIPVLVAVFCQLELSNDFVYELAPASLLLFQIKHACFVMFGRIKREEQVLLCWENL